MNFLVLVTEQYWVNKKRKSSQRTSTSNKLLFGFAFKVISVGSQGRQLIILAPNYVNLEKNPS